MEQNINELAINGIVYVRKDTVQTPQPNGKRAVVVVDRGWIFAGDVTEENGRIFLDRAVWVFRWEGVGFDGVIDNPKQSAVKLKPMKNRVDLPAEAELFRVPVGDAWGI